MTSSPNSTANGASSSRSPRARQSRPSSPPRYPTTSPCSSPELGTRARTGRCAVAGHDPENAPDAAAGDRVSASGGGKAAEIVDFGPDQDTSESGSAALSAPDRGQGVEKPGDSDELASSGDPALDALAAARKMARGGRGGRGGRDREVAKRIRRENLPGRARPS